MSNFFGGAGNGEQINKKTDEYGNNPINQHTGGNTGAYGTKTGGEYETGNKGGHGKGGILHRSNSSSSSSSEDDGEGGRRKKSIKEKIKEKLPGGNKPTNGQDAYSQSHGTTTTTPGEGYGTTTTHDAYGTEPEKKGIVEKIKERLPGGHQ